MIFVLLLSLYDVIFVLKYRFSTEKDQSEYYSSILKYWLSTSYLYQNELCLCLLLVSNFKLVFLVFTYDFLKRPFLLKAFLQYDHTLFSDGSSISTESKSPDPPATTNMVLPFSVILALP